ncbi:hypothetical protein GUJ93_ZPchr0005g15295 [Zizania palustris]|uniref:non-specific serine/threonine protein kinase n=1 Tax=Zizania palustris TaxID=103762 RepID=A0A8J5SXV5_ZIZPA|nr:hypothetical protein GUJ93_ZPchr0005g15295 [Zizania palustris]
MGAGSSVPGRRRHERRRRGGNESTAVMGWWIRLRACMSSRSTPTPARPSNDADDTTIYRGRNFTAMEVRRGGGYLQNPPRMSNAQSILASPAVGEEVNVAIQIRQFTYNELKGATRNFRTDNFLGVGGFGRVHKGWIDENGTSPARPGTGLVVAVKTLSYEGPQGHDEWVAEVHYLRNLRHPHLVKLIGYCIEGRHRQLVYEFMSGGSLENHLFRSQTSIPWSTRLKVMLGAAKGLTFLHEGLQSPVIFRDFKTSNILLDAEFNAKLSDFGLAIDGPEGDKTHVSTRVVGTYGYAAPEYVMTGHLTSMSDVYSFGVVLLEVLTGKKAMDKNRPEGEQNLVEWARPYTRDRQLFHRLIDPRLGSRFSITGAQKLVRLAHDCLSLDPKARPAMSSVVQTLEPILGLHDMATSTSFYRNVQSERAAMLFSSPPPPVGTSASTSTTPSRTPAMLNSPQQQQLASRRRSVSNSPGHGHVSQLLQRPRGGAIA